MRNDQINKNNCAFDVSQPCYCNLCERWYKNWKRFYIHMKKHYGK